MVQGEAAPGHTPTFSRASPPIWGFIWPQVDTAAHTAKLSPYPRHPAPARSPPPSPRQLPPWPLLWQKAVYSRVCLKEVRLRKKPMQNLEVAQCHLGRTFQGPRSWSRRLVLGSSWHKYLNPQIHLLMKSVTARAKFSKSQIPKQEPGSKGVTVTVKLFNFYPRPFTYESNHLKMWSRRLIKM